ncbi:hypothetical protein L873DRAFT_198975 [Choiromyces venosus 120613-1]|uniref:Uncharacterized protein n=1 Tax=Choiromyces venosus 120613-1 TaxID=1336337 RepID=A0A3N4J243_9PEZI|nr:hypothetical protein L873DRAFT_198975 [Choiromyces venosus 120613-1]
MYMQVQINECKIGVKVRRVPHKEVSQNLEKGLVMEVLPRDDEEVARKALEFKKRLMVIA